MLNLEISKDAEKEISRLPKKHARQIVRRIDALREEPEASDTKLLKGYPFRRADIGEYRIVYAVVGETLFVEVVGKRNDSDVYRRLKRKWR
jgi:mRNA interferase RelE/StbE